MNDILNTIAASTLSPTTAFLSAATASYLSRSAGKPRGYAFMAGARAALAVARRLESMDLHPTP